MEEQDAGVKQQARNECRRRRTLAGSQGNWGVFGMYFGRWKDRELGREKVREPEPREKKLEQEIQRLKQSLANPPWKWIFSRVPCKQ
jgi:hypothetical protein